MLRTCRPYARGPVLPPEVQERIMHFVPPTTSIWLFKVQPTRPWMRHFDEEGDAQHFHTMMIPSLDLASAASIHDSMIFAGKIDDDDGLAEFLDIVESSVTQRHPNHHLHVFFINNVAICDWSMY